MKIFSIAVLASVLMLLAVVCDADAIGRRNRNNVNVNVQNISGGGARVSNVNVQSNRGLFGGQRTNVNVSSVAVGSGFNGVGVRSVNNFGVVHAHSGFGRVAHVNSYGVRLGYVAAPVGFVQSSYSGFQFLGIDAAGNQVFQNVRTGQIVLR